LKAEILFLIIRFNVDYHPDGFAYHLLAGLRQLLQKLGAADRSELNDLEKGIQN
jgi:hypothetical protein